MPDPAKLILASASPRRAQLLKQIGVDFQVRPVSLCETPLAQEAPRQYVSRLAVEKAQACQEQWLHENPDASVVVLGSDTTVVCEAEIIGKPRDQQHFCQLMGQLSGNTQRVLTAVAVTDGSRTEVRVSETRVVFRHITEQEIADYWLTGEPHDKAGGYAIQGLGAIFVSAIEGSYSGVVGLPLLETAELLQAFQISCWR